MPPKKVSADTSDAPAGEPQEEQRTDVRKPVKKVSPHPSTMEMVKEALTALDQRKGVSAQAVRTFIKEKYSTVDETRLKMMVRKALVKGIDSGTFIRPANSSTTTGAQGRFRLAVRKSKAVKSKDVENVNPNVKQTKEAKEKMGDVKMKRGTSAAVGETKAKKAMKDSTASKVAPAKKPKAKRTAGGSDSHVTDEDGGPKIQKTSKASKGEEEEKSSTKKGGKKVVQKTPADPEAEETLSKKGKKKPVPKPEEAEATAPKKGGKKTVPKADDGEPGGRSAGKKSKKGSAK